MRAKSSVRRFTSDSASTTPSSMALDGSSRTLRVIFVRASSAPVNCPHRSTRARTSLSSSPSSSHSSPAASISASVRGRSRAVCALSFSNSSIAFSVFAAARSAAMDADSIARSAGAANARNAAPHAATEATHARNAVRTSGPAPTVTVTEGGGERERAGSAATRKTTFSRVGRRRAA